MQVKYNFLGKRGHISGLLPSNTAKANYQVAYSTARQYFLDPSHAAGGYNYISRYYIM